MNILHGTWIPKLTDNFIQTGNFYLWIEKPTNTTANHLKHLAEFILDIFGSFVKY